jgi:fatty-acyl-CoA synthase
VYLPLTPLRFLHRAVELYGEKVGIVSGTSRFTYAEFAFRCARAAAGLQTLGVAVGSRVAYLSRNRHELLEGYYAAPAISAVFVPLHTRSTARDLSYCLQLVRPTVLVYAGEFDEIVQAVRGETPDLHHLICLDRVTSPSGFHYDDVLAAGRDALPDWTHTDETSPAAVFFTSGTSGLRKAVTFSHRTLYLHAVHASAFYHQRDSGVELIAFPLFHANGWGRPHTATMHGIKQVLLPRFCPPEVLAAIAAEQVTHMGMVPTMARDLLRETAAGSFDLSSLRQITLGGALSSPELVEVLRQRFGCEIVTGYGLTESGPVIASSFPKSTVGDAEPAEANLRRAMAGWPIVGSEIQVRNTEGGEVPRDGITVGEVFIRSDAVADSILDLDGTEMSPCVENGWLPTGDLATCDAEGYVQIVDRAKDIIISGGENISSVEIEAALLQHPGVLECAVVAKPDAHWGETPVAIVVPVDLLPLDKEDLKGFLAGRIARFKIPHHYQFWTTPLPRTETGKIAKGVLREPFWAGKSLRVHGGHDSEDQE